MQTNNNQQLPIEIQNFKRDIDNQNIIGLIKCLSIVFRVKIQVHSNYVLINSVPVDIITVYDFSKSVYNVITQGGIVAICDNKKA